MIIVYPKTQKLTPHALAAAALLESPHTRYHVCANKRAHISHNFYRLSSSSMCLWAYRGRLLVMIVIISRSSADVPLCPSAAASPLSDLQLTPLV
jgi:hypothetical protein